MYTGFYQVNTDFIKFLQGGTEQQELAKEETNFFTVLEGKLVAKVMALLIEHGFQAFATIDAVVKKNSFFEENFLILDDSAQEALYQGKFLIRTRQPGDQMNVWFGFLQGNGLLAPLSNIARKLREKTGDRLDFYSILKSTDLVATKTLSEAEADQYENDPDRVDLVLRFQENINTGLETSGMFPLKQFQTYILPYLDFIYFDLKLIHPEESRKFTGRSNEQIIENFLFLNTDAAVPVIARIPLIPGITATENNLTGISQFLQKLGITACALMPYNPLWQDKAVKNGVNLSYAHPEFMSPRQEENCVQFFLSKPNP